MSGRSLARREAVWFAASVDAAARRTLAAPPVMADGRTPATVRLVLLVAAVRLVAPVALGAAGIALWLASGPVAVLLAVFLVLAALSSLPTLRSAVVPSAVVRRAEAPHLFARLDRVSGAVGARPFHELWLSPGTVARAERTRWRRRPVLAIGASLWAALTPAQRTALVAHQAAHLTRRELRLAHQGWLALAVVHEWWLASGGRRPEGAGEHDVRRLVSTAISVLLWPLRMLVPPIDHLLVTALAPVTQRGEQLADRDAVLVAGRAPVLALLDVTLSGATIETALTRAAVTRADLAATVRDATRAVGEDVLAERRARAAAAGVREPGHPATDLRRRLLEAAVIVPAQPVASDRHVDLDGWDEVDAELRVVLGEVLLEHANALRYSRGAVGIAAPEVVLDAYIAGVPDSGQRRS